MDNVAPTEGLLQPFDFYPLAQGFMPGQPPGALAPGSGLPLWRDMLNLRTYQGRLRFREPVIAASLGTPSFSINSASHFAMPLLVAEIPQSQYGNAGSRHLVVTTMDWFIVVATTWYNVTPIHSTGTVAVATTAVTGTGTAWLDRGIKPGDLIRFNGAGSWFYITAVGSNTSITLESTAGTIGAGATYEIRRTMLGIQDYATRVGCHMRIFNGDVYVSSLVAGGRTVSASFNTADGSVVKIASAAVETVLTFNSTNSSFLTAGSREVEVGVDNVGFNFEPLGLETLEDGRLVLPCHWFDFAANAAGGSRVLYSSHLSLAVWSTSPGGFSDILQRTGHLTGQGKLGRSLTFHFTDQIRLGEPTGQDDPPLAFPETAAGLGAIGRHALCTTPMGELFIGHDGNLYAFDGSREQLVESAPVWAVLRDYSTEDLRCILMVADRHENTISIFYSARLGTDTFRARSYELRFNYAQDILTRHSYPFHVHAVSSTQLSATGVNYNLSRSTRQRLFGVASFGNSVSSNLVYIASEDIATTQADAVANVDTLAAEMPYAETDDWDFGMPTEKKVIERIEVWCRSNSSGSETLEIVPTTEGVTALTAVSSTATLAGEAEVLFTFYTTFEPSRLWRFKIRAASGDTSFIAQMIRMRVYVKAVGDVRAAA